MRIIFTLISILFSANLFSQQVSGTWEGSLDIQGTELPVVFHVVKLPSGKYTASFDSPKQNSYNNPCSDIFVTTDSIIIKMEAIRAQYDGKLSESNTILVGTFSQAGNSFPLEMKKSSEEVKIKTINRPQTPKPPFPYKSEEVVYTNADNTIQFGATFTVPLPDPNVDYFRAPVYPVVLLITGSGPQDRDETIFDHKPFAVIADYLTRQGIAVLRVDDRGVGKTTGNFRTATTLDFAKDVNAGIEYLRKRADVDTNFIGLIGHSEGGLIAPMVASSRNDIKFIVLMAGPGIKIIDMMAQQSADVMASNGISASDIMLHRPLYKNLITAILNAKDSTAASQNAISVFKKWQSGKPDSTVINTTGVTDEKSLVSFTNVFIKGLNSPWFKYFMNMDPQEYLLKTTCRVLAINGEKDIQVAAKPNLAGIKKAMEKNKNTNYTTIEIPGLNHLFQNCKKCNLAEYAELEESFDPKTLVIISDWIKTEGIK